MPRPTPLSSVKRSYKGKSKRAPTRKRSKPFYLELALRRYRRVQNGDGDGDEQIAADSKPTGPRAGPNRRCSHQEALGDVISESTDTIDPSDSNVPQQVLHCIRPSVLQQAVCEDCGRVWIVECDNVDIDLCINQEKFIDLKSHPLFLTVLKEAPDPLCEASSLESRAQLSCIVVGPQDKYVYKWKVNHKGRGSAAYSGCQIAPILRSDCNMKDSQVASGSSGESNNLVNPICADRSEVSDDIATANILRSDDETNTHVPFSTNSYVTNLLGTEKNGSNKNIKPKESKISSRIESNIDIKNLDLSVENEESYKPGDRTVTENTSNSVNIGKSIKSNLVDNENKNVSESTNNSDESHTDAECLNNLDEPHSDSESSNITDEPHFDDNVDCVVKKEIEWVNVKEECIMEESYDSFESIEQLYTNPLDAVARKSETSIKGTKRSRSPEGKLQPTKIGENKKLLESTAYNQQHSQAFVVKPLRKSCLCGFPGIWYNRMLECQRCKRWYHETCVNCLDYNLICGDLFYLYVCEFCNSGREFIHRLPINWEIIVHLALWNLSNPKNNFRKNNKYFEYKEDIATWVNSHWELLQCPPELQSIPINNRPQHILEALQENSEKFLCGKNIWKAKTTIWALRLDRDTPSVPEIILPPENPITEALMHKIIYCERTVFHQIPKKPQVEPPSVVNLNNENHNKVQVILKEPLGNKSNLTTDLGQSITVTTPSGAIVTTVQQQSTESQVSTAITAQQQSTESQVSTATTAQQQSTVSQVSTAIPTQILPEGSQITIEERRGVAAPTRLQKNGPDKITVCYKWPAAEQPQMGKHASHTIVHLTEAATQSAQARSQNGTYGTTPWNSGVNEEDPPDVANAAVVIKRRCIPNKKYSEDFLNGKDMDILVSEQDHESNSSFLNVCENANDVSWKNTTTEKENESNISHDSNIVTSIHNSYSSNSYISNEKECNFETCTTYTIFEQNHFTNISSNENSSEESVEYSVNINNRDACIPNGGSFLRTDVVIQLLLTFDGDPLDEVPLGNKKNVSFIVRNQEIHCPVKNGHKYMDDVGGWAQGGTTKYINFIFRKGRYLVNKKSKRDKDLVLKLTRRYDSCKRESRYKRKISWITILKDVTAKQEFLVLYEYEGPLPTPSMKNKDKFQSRNDAGDFDTNVDLNISSLVNSLQEQVEYSVNENKRDACIPNGGSFLDSDTVIQLLLTFDGDPLDEVPLGNKKNVSFIVKQEEIHCPKKKGRKYYWDDVGAWGKCGSTHNTNFILRNGRYHIKKKSEKDKDLLLILTCRYDSCKRESRYKRKMSWITILKDVTAKQEFLVLYEYKGPLPTSIGNNIRKKDIDYVKNHFDTMKNIMGKVQSRNDAGNFDTNVDLNISTLENSLQEQDNYSVNENNRSACIPNGGAFLETDAVIQLLLTFDGDPLDEVPLGNKKNVSFIVKKEEIHCPNKNRKYLDDVGAWEHGGSTKNANFILRNGKYQFKKKIEKVEDLVLILTCRYDSCKRESRYKRKISWINMLKDVTAKQEFLVLYEYEGPLPTTLSGHGNVKKWYSHYVKTHPDTIKKIKGEVQRNDAGNVDTNVDLNISTIEKSLQEPVYYSVNENNRDACIPNDGAFLDTDVVIQLLLTFDGDPLDEVPLGNKQNVSFIVKKEEIHCPNKNSRTYWDDVGVWGKGGSTNNINFILRNGRYHVQKKSEKDEDLVLILTCRYDRCKREFRYKRKISWINMIKNVTAKQEFLVLYEYEGPLPTTLSFHGNSKKKDSHYVKTHPNTMKKKKRKVQSRNDAGNVATNVDLNISTFENSLQVPVDYLVNENNRDACIPNGGFFLDTDEVIQLLLTFDGDPLDEIPLGKTQNVSFIVKKEEIHCPDKNGCKYWNDVDEWESGATNNINFIFRNGRYHVKKKSEKDEDLVLILTRRYDYCKHEFRYKRKISWISMLKDVTAKQEFLVLYEYEEPLPTTLSNHGNITSL